jgi:hypothetical protein
MSADVFRIAARPIPARGPSRTIGKAYICLADKIVNQPEMMRAI